MDAFGKCAALLGQVFLMFGGGRVALRLACRRVRAIVTNIGTERKIANMVSDFAWMIDPKRAQPTEAEELLRPRALAIPGRRHQVDVLIRFSVSPLPS